MKLKYSKQPLSEGGAAVQGCGTIHLSELIDTLSSLTDKLELSYNLFDFVVGSTGKSEYSGDIDIVIDKIWFDFSVEEFHTDLKKMFPAEDIVRRGSTIHLRYPISSFNDAYQERLPRTGFVQVDFMFGDLNWERFFHFSPGDTSEYKGFHRNIALSAITASTASFVSSDLDSFGRPVSINRWKWSPKGLLKIVRYSRQQKNGKWLKAQLDDIVDGPYLDHTYISEVIFPKDGTPDDLNSLETIILAIKRNYGIEMQNSIFRQIASNFMDKEDALYFTYPPEIEQYFSINDK